MSGCAPPDNDDKFDETEEIEDEEEEEEEDEEEEDEDDDENLGLSLVCKKDIQSHEFFTL